MAKIEEKTAEKIEKVVVRYNGPAGWDINYPTRGKFSVQPGKCVEFNPHDPYELAALLGVIKWVNSGHMNYRTRYTKNNAEGGKDLEKVYKFAIESGKEFLPPILLQHKFSGSDMFTDDEAAAIRGICPKFFERPDLKRRITV